VVSRALENALENNLVCGNQMHNGRSDDKLMQNAKTDSMLDLLQNPMYAINLSLRRKLSKEIALTSDVRLCDNGIGSGATVAVVGGAAAMTDGVVAAGSVAQVHLIQQAHPVLKEGVKGGIQKSGDMTPSNPAFSKSDGSHHRFSRNKLFESSIIDINQVSRDSFAAAGYTRNSNEFK
jgi:hypothetical protein